MKLQSEVILVGIGGIGSTIVNDLYKKEKDRGIENINAVILDTDINDLAKKKNVDPQYKIQTTEIGSVASMLTEEDKEFFPEHPSFDRLQMTDGAGMIRAISYLAFKKAEEKGKFNVFENLVNDVYRIGNNITEKNVKIVVVSSLMGGTGSGMFLAVPLLLRDYFEAKYATDKVDITGFFVMPEVMQGVIPDERKEEIYSNTYAALRELNGLTVAALSDDLVLTMQYKGSQVDKNGNRVIEAERVPYDRCFFINNTNMKGETLDNCNEAFNMLGNIIDEYYFSEMSGKINSRMANNITGIVAGGGTNLYGGIALSKIVYPYEEVLDFVNTKWLSKSMRENLLFIDKQYEMKLEQYKKDEKNGVMSEKPDLLRTYVDVFESEADKDQINLCKKIKNKIVIKNEKGDVKESKIDNIKKTFGIEIVNGINNDETLNESLWNLKSDLKTLNTQGKNSEIFEKKINDITEKIDDIRTYIDKISVNSTKTKAKTMLGILKEEDVNKSVLYKNLNGIHIIGQRYIIYKLIAEYSKRLAELKKDRISLNSKFDKQTLMYESKRGESISAISKFREVNQSKGLFSRNLKKFKQEYIDNIQAFLKNIETYKLTVTKIYAYEEMIDILTKFAHIFEKFFENIDIISQELDLELTAKSSKELEAKNSVTQKVLGKLEYKEHLFNQIEDKLDYGNLFETLSINIFEALYKEYIRKEILKTNHQEINYKEIFDKEIKEECKETMRQNSIQYLNFDIYEAIRKEASYKDVPFDSYLEDKIKQLVKNAYPWIRLDENAKAHTDIIMSVNDEVYNKFSNKSMLHDSMRILGASEVFVNNEIDDKTIKIINLKSTVALKDLNETKTMYEYYKNKIDKLPVDDLNTIKCRTITPHIDKRWHVILPYIDDESKMMSLEEETKSFLAGFITDSFKRNKNIEKDGYTFSFIDKSTPISITKQGVEIKDSYSALYNSIKFDNAKKSMILEKYADFKESVKMQAEYFDFNNKETILDVPNIQKLFDISISNTNKEHFTLLDIVIKYYKDVEISQRNSKETSELIEMFISKIKEIVRDIIPSFAITEKSENEIYDIIINKIVSDSKLKEEIDVESNEYMKIISPLISK